MATVKKKFFWGFPADVGHIAGSFFLFKEEEL